MKFTTAVVAATVLATGASAQLSASSPLQLLGYATQLLSSDCRTAVTGLLAANSSLSQCLHTSNLLPILNNTQSSIIPNVNDYLVSVCASPACDPSIISNAADSVLSHCSTDLGNFGISNNTVRTIMGAYPTARDVACLSSNSTSMTNMTMMTGNSTLCPTSLLYQLQSYLGVDLTNKYVDGLILGANATAYQQVMSIPQNATILRSLGCNDCVAAAIDVVLQDYPQLQNTTLNIPKLTNMTGATLPSFYQGACAMTVSSNMSKPASINETAYNSTAFNMTMSTNMTSSPIMTTTATATVTSAAVVATGSIASVISSVASIAASETATATGATRKRFAKWD